MQLVGRQPQVLAIEAFGFKRGRQSGEVDDHVAAGGHAQGLGLEPGIDIPALQGKTSRKLQLRAFGHPLDGGIEPRRMNLGAARSLIARLAGKGAHDRDALAAMQWQRRIIVLEQDHRLLGGPLRHAVVGFRVRLAVGIKRRTRLPDKLQRAAHGPIDMRHIEQTGGYRIADARIPGAFIARHVQVQARR